MDLNINRVTELGLTVLVIKSQNASAGRKSGIYLL